MVRWGLGWWLGIVMMTVASVCPAQPADEAASTETIDEETMVKRFEEAQALYREGRFSESAAVLVKLIAIRPEPVLYYNLARAYDGDGQLDQAIAAYERYLELDPDIGDRGAIEQRVATLEAQLEERRRLEREAAMPAPTPPRSRDTASDDGALLAVPWIMVGVGAATLIAGAVLGGLSASRRSSAGDATVHADAVSALDEAEAFALGANVSFIAGGLLGAAGATWLIVDAATDGPPDEVGLRVTFRF